MPNDKEMTAMQELIEWLMLQDELLMNKTKMILVGKADSLLGKEKQQIIQSRMSAPIIPSIHGNSIKETDYLIEAEDYFTNKYQQP